MQRSAQKRPNEIARQQRQRDKMAARIARKKGKDEGSGGGAVLDGSEGVSALEADRNLSFYRIDYQYG